MEKEIIELRKQLNHHNHLYYVESRPEISDFDFDHFPNAANGAIGAKREQRGAHWDRYLLQLNIFVCFRIFVFFAFIRY